MSRFNYLLDQLKSPDVKAVLGVLLMAKSKLIKVRNNIFSGFMGHYFDSAHLFRPSYQCLLLAFLQDDVLIHMNFNCNISVIQWYIKCNNGLLCPVMAGTGHQDY